MIFDKKCPKNLAIRLDFAEKCKKSKTLRPRKPNEPILAMLMLKFSFKMVKTATDVTVYENIYSFFLVKLSDLPRNWHQKFHKNINFLPLNDEISLNVLILTY